MSADPGLLRTVPDTSGATVTATGSLVHLCPHVPETDVGTVEVKWLVGELTLELHAFVAYLASWHDQRVSHEEVTAQIRADLEAIDGLEVLTVITRWQTAGLAVVVER